MKKITFLVAALCATMVANATTIAEVIAAGEALADGKQTTEYYEVTGEVVYFKASTSYGNADMVIKDATGVLYCWRTTDVDGAKFTTEDAVAVGSTVTVNGQVKRWDKLNISSMYADYDNKIEMTYGKLVATPSAIRDVEAMTDVYARDGRIYAEEGARIYTVTGLDVTRQNGQLNGIYVVKAGNKVAKVVVR